MRILIGVVWGVAVLFVLYVVGLSIIPQLQDWFVYWAAFVVFMPFVWPVLFLWFLFAAITERDNRLGSQIQALQRQVADNVSINIADDPVILAQPAVTNLPFTCFIVCPYVYVTARSEHGRGVNIILLHHTTIGPLLVESVGRHLLDWEQAAGVNCRPMLETPFTVPPGEHCVKGYLAFDTTKLVGFAGSDRDVVECSLALLHTATNRTIGKSRTFCFERRDLFAGSSSVHGEVRPGILCADELKEFQDALTKQQAAPSYGESG